MLGFLKFEREVKLIFFRLLICRYFLIFITVYFRKIPVTLFGTLGGKENVLYF